MMSILRDAAFVQSRFCHPRIRTRTILVSDAQIGIPKSVLFIIQVPTELLRTVLPAISWQEGDHTDVVQEEPQDLRCSTMIWATCVVGRRIQISDILTVEVSTTMEHLPFLTSVQADVASAVHIVRILVALQRQPLLLRPSFEMQTNPAL